MVASIGGRCDGGLELPAIESGCERVPGREKHIGKERPSAEDRSSLRAPGAASGGSLAQSGDLVLVVSEAEASPKALDRRSPAAISVSVSVAVSVATAVAHGGGPKGEAGGGGVALGPSGGVHGRG